MIQAQSHPLSVSHTVNSMCSQEKNSHIYFFFLHNFNLLLTCPKGKGEVILLIEHLMTRVVLKVYEGGEHGKRRR